MRIKLILLSIFLLTTVDVLAVPIDEELDSPIDCYDYNYDPPRYILGMCDPTIDEGPYYTDRSQGPPFGAPTGWEWQFNQCIECPPGYGDWTLSPLQPDPVDPVPVDTPEPLPDIDPDISYPPDPPLPDDSYLYPYPELPPVTYEDDIFGDMPGE